jgi:hypothetical protein
MELAAARFPIPTLARTMPEPPAATPWHGAGRSALQRRIVAALIVETEARPLGGGGVESLRVTPVIYGR